MIVFKGITHTAIAISFYFYLFGFNLFNMAAIIVGSLLPDIDTPYSLLGKYNILSHAMKHRGITHTLIGMLIFALFVYVLFGNFVWGFVFGYILHLIFDTITPMGIMWLYPYNKKYYSFLRKNKKPS